MPSAPSRPESDDILMTHGPKWTLPPGPYHGQTCIFVVGLPGFEPGTSVKSRYPLDTL
jgi:hypothetical protein